MLREMEMEIAAWVEALGYQEVLSALITTCHYWATHTASPPLDGSTEVWRAREQALRQAQREGP